MYLSLVVAALLSPSPRLAPPPPTLDEKITSILPTADDDTYRQAGWRTHLMQARQEAQTAGKPIFLWIMVGNPQGVT